MNLGILASSVSKAYTKKSVAASATGNIATTFDSQYSGFTLDSGTGDKSPWPTESKPAKSTDIMSGGYTDQRFNTKIRRVTAVADQTGTSANIMRHEYSRRQCFNCDSSLMLMQGQAGWWFLYDASSLEIIPSGVTSGAGTDGIVGFAGDCEPIWHPTDPLKIWYTAQNGGSLIWYERTFSMGGGSGTTTTLFDLTSKLSALGSPWNTADMAWFQGEGRPSDNGRYWGLAIESNPGSPTNIGAILYDRQADTILFAVATSGNRPNWTSTSPLGDRVILSWYGTAQASLSAEAAQAISAADGVRAYNSATTFTTLSVLGEHSDMVLGADGTSQYYCHISYHGFADGGADGLIAHEIGSGTIWNFSNHNPYSGGEGGYHISGTCTDRPGWFLVTRYGSTGVVGTGAYSGQVVAIECKQTSARQYRLAHHRAIRGAEYFREAQASVNRDFTRVVYASDWGTDAWPSEAYVICLPSPAAGGIPHPATT